MVSLVAPLAGLEIYLRVFEGDRIEHHSGELARRKLEATNLLNSAHDQMARRLQLHPFYGYTAQPALSDVPGVDRYGFRNTEAVNWLAPPEGRKVAVIVGGSAAWGTGIPREEDTISKRLEARLNAARPDQRWLVVSLAGGGWHYPQQFIVISRWIEHVDLVVTYDGFNDVFIPLMNTFGGSEPTPPDFPQSYAMLAQPSDDLTLARYGQLESETDWNPDGYLEQSAVYTWIRYRFSERARQNLMTYDSAPRTDVRMSREPTLPRESAEDVITFGINEYLRYSRLIDAVAGEYRVPVLHVIQPFRHADPRVPMPRIQDLPEAVLEKLQRPHLGFYYAWLRERAAKQYGEDKGRPGVSYLDLAEALPSTDDYWVDYIHSNAIAADIIAARLMQQLSSSGALDVR